MHMCLFACVCTCICVCLCVCVCMRSCTIQDSGSKDETDDLKGTSKFRILLLRIAVIFELRDSSVFVLGIAIQRPCRNA